MTNKTIAYVVIVTCSLAIIFLVLNFLVSYFLKRKEKADRERRLSTREGVVVVLERYTYLKEEYASVRLRAGKENVRFFFVGPSKLVPARTGMGSALRISFILGKEVYGSEQVEMVGVEDLDGKVIDDQHRLDELRARIRALQDNPAEPVQEKVAS